MADWSFPSRLRDLLDPAGRKLGLEGAVDAGRLFARWSGIVGPDIAAHVEPTSLRQGVLRVRTDSPAWATEMAYLSGDIASRVNSAMGREVVLEIKVSTGPRTAGPTRPSRPEANQAPGPNMDPSVEPDEALARARRAWDRKRRKSGPDQGF
jgi:predicted nucleic acid-binding Zn ribbon protein